MSKLKIAMKKSEYERARTEHWSSVYRLQEGVSITMVIANDVAAVEALGVEWEPEEVEWPELRTGMRQLGGHALFPIHGGGMEPDVAERVVNAWNARRPGGSMEWRLRDLVKEFCRPSVSPKSLWAARCIEHALRLGVEEPIDDEPGDD